jgi:CRP/FNR family transcriptional regulator
MDTDQLRNVPLLRQLPAARLVRLAEASEAHAVPRGRSLFRQGQRASAIWIILKGWVHLIRSADPHALESGVVIFTITPEEVLCGLSVLDGGLYSATAVAATDVTAVRMPAALFTDALTHERMFAFHALRLCTRRLRSIAEQYGSMAEPVSHRIVRSILRLSQQFGSTIPVTHRELGQMSWTTTESAIRIVRQLKQQGLMSGRRGEITVTDLAQLERTIGLGNGHRSTGA